MSQNNSDTRRVSSSMHSPAIFLFLFALCRLDLLVLPFLTIGRSRRKRSNARGWSRANEMAMNTADDFELGGIWHLDAALSYLSV